MPIKYYLQPNPVTPDPNDQSARVYANKVHDVDSLIQQMLKRGSTVTEPDIRAVLNLFFEVSTDEVADGNNINLPLVNIRPGITGVYTDVTDSFDSARHAKKANLSSGLLLNAKMQAATVEKITQPLPSPVLLQFTDVTTQTTNSILSPGGIGQISGEELKFDINNAAEGIFFTSAGVSTKATMIASRTEGKLMFGIPAGLAAGSYTVEVRRGYGGNSTVRTGTLADSLQVQ